jgi:hypothetical protein
MPNMSQEAENVVLATIYKILRPIVSFMLRKGVSYQAFAAIAKRVFVDVASEDFALEGRKLSQSRVSVLTGIHRKEIATLKDRPHIDQRTLDQQFNRAARVVSGWKTDARFLDGKGEPLVLPIEGEEPSFHSLVRLYSGDIPVRAVMDELLRVGAVHKTAEDTLMLAARSYIPWAGEAEKLSIFGYAVSDLIRTIEHNLSSKPEDVFFQRMVAYDNLPEEILSQLRAYAVKQSQPVIENADQWIAKYDRDRNPEIHGSGRVRAGIGIYYFEHDYNPEEP